MVVIAIPILTSRKVSDEEGRAAFDRTEYYSTAKNLLTSGADAMERLMTAYKEIVELAGYTHRVANMMVVFEDCSKGAYKRPGATVKDIETKGGSRLELELKDGVPTGRGDVEETKDGTIVLDTVSSIVVEAWYVCTTTTKA